MQGSQMIYAMSAGKYTGGFAFFRPLAIVTAAVLWLGGATAAQPAAGAWREAPEFVGLFTPDGGAPGEYSAFTSPRPLDEVLRDLTTTPGLVASAGAWTPQTLVALDAFGRQGRYNRWTLARLFGARRPRVARGPRAEAGRVVESWTLFSPYPDPAITRLEPGTLLIVVRLP